MYIDEIKIANPRITAVFGPTTEREHVHECFQLFYPVNGMGSIRIHERVYRLKPGNMYFVSPGIVHSCNFPVGTNYYIADFHILENELANKFKKLPFESPLTNPQLVTLLLEQVLKQNYSRNAMAKFYKNAYFTMLLTALTDSSFSLVFNLEPASGNGSGRLNRTILDDGFNSLLGHLRSSYNLEHSVESMCRYSGYQRSQLFRLFKARVGTTPHKYINSLRIRQAKELLRDLDISITDIAYIVGFQSYAVFRAAFQKSENLSPKGYRMKIRTELK